MMRIRKSIIITVMIAAAALLTFACAGNASSAESASSFGKTAVGASRSEVYSLKSGSVVHLDATKGNTYFQIYAIKQGDSVYKRIAGKSFKTSGRMPLSDLRYLKVLYVGFDGKTHVGEIIVNRKIANKTKAVFLQLYRKKYPVKSMKLIDDYYKKRGEDGNKADWRSMEADNTSAFNYRYITHTRNLSNHSWGRAIDLNPRENPYSRKVNGVWRAIDHSPKLDKYAQHRSSAIPHVITRKDTAYKIFVRAGFFWGGNWTQTPDYQHFEFR